MDGVSILERKNNLTSNPWRGARFAQCQSPLFVLGEGKKVYELKKLVQLTVKQSFKIFFV